MCHGSPCGMHRNRTGWRRVGVVRVSVSGGREIVRIVNKEYIGDGVYVWTEGVMIWLSVQRESGQHLIALEPEVFEALLQYAMKIGWPTPGRQLKERSLANSFDMRLGSTKKWIRNSK